MNNQGACLSSILQIGGMVTMTGCCLLMMVGLIFVKDSPIFSSSKRSEPSTQISSVEVLTFTVHWPASFRISITRTPTLSPNTSSIDQPIDQPILSSPTATSSPLPEPRPLPKSTPTVQSQSPSTQISNPDPLPPTATLASPLPGPLNPTSRFAQPEQPATRLVIPELALDIPVILAPIVNQTWAVHHLGWSAGHLEGTSSPGAAGNIVLAAHATLPPSGLSGPFFALQTLQPGQMVIVYDQEQAFTYQIEAVHSVKPSQIDVTYPTDRPRLTPITCLNYNPALARYDDRLVVMAALKP